MPDVVLASGGGRGITARCVVALAYRFGWQFVLFGRTALEEALPAWADADSSEAELKRRAADELAADGSPARPVEIQRRYEQVCAQLEVESTLRAVREAGGAADYVCVDVGDTGLGEALAPAVKDRTVTGIVHGAGALADRALEKKSGADFDRVFVPKARGLRTLLNAVDPDALRFVALFSSAAGFYGHAGQADYALANEVLNKAAHRLRARLPRCRVVAFDWGPWGGGAGMVTPELQRHFDARGVGLLMPEDATGILCDALALGAEPAPQLVVGSLPSPEARRDDVPREHRIVRRLREAANPFLRDHVIGGRSVLPVTCAMAWIADACESRYPGLYAVRLEECRVLSGIVLAEDEETELTLELTDTARAAESGEVRMLAEISRRQGETRPHPHYRAEVVLARERPPSPRSSPSMALAADADGAAYYQDGTLFHGPAFQGVRRLSAFDDRGLELECRLPYVPEHVQGQFRAGTVNPYVADALFQGIVVWARKTFGAASLPVCTEAAELYRPLEFDRGYTVSVAVRESSEHRLVADIDAVDGEGDVCLRLLCAEVALSSTLARLFVPAGTAAMDAA
jgi:NAD(P)-dependent dehydrogenase (short-subunit alcohol dehydrogenase family)